MLDEFEETKFPTHLNLKFFCGESTTCIFWHMKEYFRLIKSGKKKTRERKKRLKLQTRWGHSTAFESCARTTKRICAASAQLLPVPSDPFQELSRTRWIPCTRHDSTRLAAHCAEYFAGDLISCRELRSVVELLNGATDQGLVGVWLQESWEYQNFAHSFCSLSLPKYFSSSSCLPPQSLRVFVRCLSSTPTDSLQRVCRVTWPGSQAGMAA